MISRGRRPAPVRGFGSPPPRARSALEHRRTVLELLRTTQKPSFVRIERKARRQRPQAPGCISLGHRFHRQFFAFQTFGPLLADLSAIRSETNFALPRQPTAYPQRLGVSFRDPNEGSHGDTRERVAIGNPVTTFRRALAVSTTGSWASATDRLRILHPRPGSSFEANRNYQCSVMAALTARPGAPWRNFQSVGLAR